MHCVKLTIPRMSNTYKLYIYRSRNADDINTIAKVRTIHPTLIIDESIAEGDKYVIYDKPEDDTIAGITYFGPAPNPVPTTEYESSVEMSKVNDYTYMNVLKLAPLPIEYYGAMYYYSIIGVDDGTGMITHLSKVTGVMIDCDYETEGIRHIYSSDDMESDEWNYVSSIPWNEDIAIGDSNNHSQFKRFGIPVIETVPPLESDRVKVVTKGVAQHNYITLEIQNPWVRNNKKYNFRKLKSFKVQNVLDGQYGGFSEPTFQSLLPVSLEKMLILIKENPIAPNEVIKPSEIINNDVSVYQIIRKDGIFYTPKKHRILGVNKYNIPVGNDTAVFSEASMQNEIKFQIKASPAYTYSITFYLIDVYNNYSEPVHIVVTT